jgi:hypothetical protein
VKESPILFSGPMVRAILEGRKTQTRRVVRFNLNGNIVERGGKRCWHRDDPDALQACPYGAPGDTLWVRETFFEEYDPNTCRPYDPPRYVYRATYDGEEPYLMDGDGFPEENRDGTFKSPWKPSIHMPRRASRLTLCIKSVRVERLQRISDRDAKAEGVRELPLQEGEPGAWWCFDVADRSTYSRELWGAFQRGWNKINGERAPWATNPWCWVVEFERVAQEESREGT